MVGFNGRKGDRRVFEEDLEEFLSCCVYLGKFENRGFCLFCDNYFTSIHQK